MRWERLFADLDGQFDAAEQAELDGEVADRTRRETATVRLADRLRGAIGSPVRVQLRGGGSVSDQIARVGNDWLLLEGPAGTEYLVALPAVSGVYGLPLEVALPAGRVAARLGLGHVVRAVARDRLPVTVLLVDGVGTTGTVDRVGRDYLELAEHPDTEVRRARQVRTVRVIPFSALASLRRS